MIREAIGLVGAVAFAALLVWVSYALFRGVERILDKKSKGPDDRRGR